MKITLCRKVFAVTSIIALTMIFGCTSQFTSKRFDKDLDCEVLERKRVATKRTRPLKIKNAQHLAKGTTKKISTGFTSEAPPATLIPFLNTKPALPEADLSGIVLPVLQHTTASKNETRLNRMEKVEAVSIKQNISNAATSDPKQVIIPPDYFSSAMLFGVPTLLSLAAIFLFYPRVSEISTWAARHVHSTRLTLAGTQILATGASYYLGHLLSQNEVVIPSVFAAAGTAGFVLSTLLYPAQRSVPFHLLRSNYLNRKFYSVFVVATGMTLTTYAGNHHFSLANSPSINQFAFVHERSAFATSALDLPIEPIPFKMQQEPVKKDGKIALIIFTSILFTVLFLGVAALACTLACEGYGGWAALTFFGGEAGLAVAFASILKSISRNYKVKRREKKSTVDVQAG